MTAYDERQKYFKDKLKYYTLLSKKNEEYASTLKRIKNDLWECIITQRPEVYYFINRFNDQYEDDNKIGSLFKAWINYLPFVEFHIELKKELILDRNKSNDCEVYNWGLSSKKEYIDAFTLPINEKVENLTSEQSVYTIIDAGEKGTFSYKLLDKALKFIKDHEFSLSGDVTGNLLARVHEPDGYHRYIELWLPIKKC
ncbi:hypothetical protein [Alkalibacter mobilis]|uniref:hypothetical protein n=1 Tax=Alkalibacter mobilis TaxID=2787712 RepID=UPI00189F7C1B|nr:hypothetical protein [Alkalibacter mobilis]MBF7097889.1 hypothetical protein [Alkalibacter mobilis]